MQQSLSVNDENRRYDNIIRCKKLRQWNENNGHLAKTVKYDGLESKQSRTCLLHPAAVLAMPAFFPITEVLCERRLTVGHVEKRKSSHPLTCCRAVSSFSAALTYRKGPFGRPLMIRTRAPRAPACPLCGNEIALRCLVDAECTS